MEYIGDLNQKIITSCNLFYFLKENHDLAERFDIWMENICEIQPFFKKFNKILHICFNLILEDAIREMIDLKKITIRESRFFLKVN